MWIPGKVVTFFDRLVQSVEDNAESMQNTVQVLRDQMVELRTSNELLKSELQSTKVTNDWLRVKVNDLELTNKGLMEKAYNIKLPVPEILRMPTNPQQFENFSFEDIGDEAARKLGLPVYGDGR